MMNYGFDKMPFLQSVDPKFITLFILMIAAWTLYWKGTALWKASRLGDKNWFIALLVINTLGILEILYIYYFSKEKN